MRAIYKIARLELSNLFYSPIAWLVLILFVFMTAMNFTDVLWGYARSQEFRGGGLSDLSRTLFFDMTGRGLWPKVTNLLYMIMPLLTMGLISQEFSRGSIKLLFVAPITSRHIVLGKFLGMLMYGVVMFVVLLVYVVLAGCWFVSSFCHLCGYRSFHVYVDELPDCGSYLYVGFVNLFAFCFRFMAGVYFRARNYLLVGFRSSGRNVY